MHRYLPLLLLFGLFVLVSCKDDPPEVNRIIHYDGNNFTAPSLPEGFYEASALFTSAQVSPLVGGELIAVEYYIYSIPSKCEIKVYDQANGNEPGAVIYQRDVTSELRANAWNIHSLTIPIEIIGDGFWVSVAFEHRRDQQTIGCDAGPAKPNGDWLYDDFDGAWDTYRDRTGESVNWNIRAVVSEP